MLNLPSKIVKSCDPTRGSERAAAERLLRIGGKRIKARPSSEGWKYLLKVGELKSISFKHWAADGLGGEATARAAA